MKTVRKPNSPCCDQSDKSVKRWLRSNIKVGLIVALRHIQDGMLQYERAVVLSVRPKNFNVAAQLEDGDFPDSGAAFDTAGRSWQDPTGPIRLVAPTPAVLQACDTCKFGTSFLPGNRDSYLVSFK